MEEKQRKRAWGFLGGGLLIWLGMMALVVVVSELLFNDHRKISVEVGSDAPEFKLTSLAGKTIILSEQQGKPIILNFWATWCAPCVIEMPNLQKFYENFPGEFEVLAVNADESESTVRRFVEEMGLTFNVLLDPGSKIQSLYQVSGYPTSYFIDGQGVIRARHVGSLSEDQLSEYLLQVGVGP